MALTSTYVFDQTDLRGNFTFTNVAQLFATFSESESNSGSTSTLFVAREAREFLIDLYSRFNSADFLFLIDIAPEIGGVSTNANGGALMVLISSAMVHFGYRSSDIRAGWMEWRYVPYYGKGPGRHQDSDLLNQIAFNFHINRGIGTVDNDGWIAFYYLFFLDETGRLGAYVDGWAYQAGGGEGLPDDGPDIGPVLGEIVPQFVDTIQTFLNSFCATAAVFTPGIHDSDGYPLFDKFYLLPGDGDTSFGPVDPMSGYPAPGIGNSTRPVDVEVSLVLLPKQKVVRPPGTHVTPNIAAEVRSELKRKGWDFKASAEGVSGLKGTRVTNGRVVEIEVCFKERAKGVSNGAPVERAGSKKIKPKKKMRKK